MNVQLINACKDEYAGYIQQVFATGEAEKLHYKWSVISNWRNHFELDYTSLHQSFDKALASTYSRQLWKGEKFSIKSGMLMLIEENPMFMEAAFQNLFDESKDISMRFNRFLFHCDELLETLHKKDERINTHYQNDYAVSLYLSFEYPEKYAPFDYQLFHPFMEKIGSRNIPVEQDKERYYKIMKALYTVLSKDQEFMNNWQFVKNQADYSGPSLFLIYDVMEYSMRDK